MFQFSRIQIIQSAAESILSFSAVNLILCWITLTILVGCRPENDPVPVDSQDQASYQHDKRSVESSLDSKSMSVDAEKKPARENPFERDINPPVDESFTLRRSGQLNHGTHNTQQQNEELSSRLTASAVDLVKDGNIDGAIYQLQQALLANKNNVEANFRVMSILDDRGQQQIQSGDLKEGYRDLATAGIFARAIVGPVTEQLPKKEQAWIANALYNEACAHCFYGNQDLAIEALTLSLENGFDRPELIRTDADLDRLRSLPSFQNLINKYGRSQQPVVK